MTHHKKNKENEIAETPVAETTQAVATTPTNAGIALSRQEQAAILDQEIVTSDIKVPAIFLGQPMSEAVKSRKVLAGQMFRSDTFRVVGEAKVGNTPEKDINVIPFKIENIWQDYAINGGDKKWVRTYERNVSNENLPKEFKEGAQEMTRMRGVRLHGVILEDAKAYIEEMKKVFAEGGTPDLSKQIEPVSLLFKGGSFPTAASPTVNFFRKVKQFAKFNVAPFLYALPVRAGIGKNQDGREYFQFQVQPEIKINDPELEGMAREWFNIIKNSKVDIAEDTDADEVDTSDAIPTTAKPVHSGNFI